MNSNVLQEIATPEYFRQEICNFREVMGSTKYSLEQKDNAFKAITLLYFNVKDISGLDINFYTLTANEWTHRRLYESETNKKFFIRKAR